MKKEIKKVAGYNTVILVLALVLGIVVSGGVRDIMSILGTGLLLVAVINTIIGLIVLLAGLADHNQAVRRYGAAMLLVAGISLLSSLTFCSISFIHVY